MYLNKDYAAWSCVTARCQLHNPITMAHSKPYKQDISRFQINCDFVPEANMSHQNTGGTVDHRLSHTEQLRQQFQNKGCTGIFLAFHAFILQWIQTFTK